MADKNTPVLDIVGTFVAAVVSVTELHSGTTHNVMPADGWLGGTVRTLDPSARDALEAGIRRVADGIAHARNVGVRTSYARGFPRGPKT